MLRASRSLRGARGVLRQAAPRARTTRSRVTGGRSMTSRSIGHWMIAIAALAAAPGCRKDDPPPDDNNHDGGGGKKPPDPPPDAASGSGGPREPAPLPAPSLAECLKVDLKSDEQISDPHGQGSDLLGLGFKVSGKIFVRVDQFDTATFKN